MRCPVLVSRADEMTRLREALRLPADGRGGLWVVRGEPGVGKSRIVAALTEEAGRAGTVMSGRAVRAAAPVPLRPLAEALLAWLRTGAVPEDRRLAPYLPALGRLAPQLGAATDDGASSLMLIGEGLLRLATALGGIVLVVEDLHWADPETLGVLEYVADNARAVPLLVLATMRPHDAPAVADLVEVLRGRGSADIVDLEPLGEPDVGVMLRACLDGEPPDGLDQLVRRFSAGYPLLVEEVLADLHASGALVRDADGWLVRCGLEVSVPPSFVRSVRSRLDAVSAQAREVMEAAALLGMQFDWQVVGAALGLDDRATATAVRELATERLVVAVGDGFEIRHALTREAVLEGLLPPDRRRLAAALAGAVEERAGDEDGSAEAHQVLAELFEAAGDRARAAGHWLAVGRASIATGALTSALTALERAGRLVFPSTEAGLDVREAVVEAHALAGDVPAALEVGESLIAELADRADDPDRLTALRLRLARALLSGGRWDEAETMLEAAAGRDLALDRVLAARLALGRHDDERAAERAREALGAVGPDRPEVACEAWEVLGRAARRDVVEAAAAFEEGYRLADEHGLVLWRCRLLAALGSLDLVHRRPSADRLVAARRAALAAGAIATAARAELDLDMVRLQYHRLDEAAASLDNAITMMERLRIPDVGAGYGIRAVVHGLAGRTAEMEADVAAMERTVSNEALLAIGLPAHVRAVHAIGHARYDEALEWLDRAMEGSRRYPGFPLSFRGYWALLDTALRGDGAAARAEVRAGTQASSPQNWFGLRCADAVALGRNGEREEAEKVFADAEWALPGEEPWLEVHARLLVARAAAADGWGQPEQWFRSVLDALVGLGQTEAASACRVAMREAGFAVPRRAVGSDRVPPHLQRIGVTAREYDVLELVVAGLANREIAERLYLSVRTVETHVARLLQRTGASERGELAAHLAG